MEDREASQGTELGAGDGSGFEPPLALFNDSNEEAKILAFQLEKLNYHLDNLGNREFYRK